MGSRNSTYERPLDRDTRPRFDTVVINVLDRESAEADAVALVTEPAKATFDETTDDDVMEAYAARAADATDVAAAEDILDSNKPTIVDDDDDAADTNEAIACVVAASMLLVALAADTNGVASLVNEASLVIAADDTTVELNVAISAEAAPATDGAILVTIVLGVATEAAAPADANKAYESIIASDVVATDDVCVCT